MPTSVFAKIRNPEDQALTRTQDAIAQVLNPIAERLMNTPIMGAPPPPWLLPQLVNGFANFGGAFAPAGFHKDALGYVHTKGVLVHAAGTAANTTICVLPVGYRPAQTQRFAVEGNGATVQFISVTRAGVCTNEVLIAAAGTCDFAFSFLAEQ